MPSLYVTEPGSRIEKEAGQLLVTLRGEVLFSVPAIRIDAVILVGPVGVTTPALGFLLDRGISLVFLTSAGKYRGRLSADLSSNARLRHLQHQRADDEQFALNVSRGFIEGKLRNCRTLCMRWDETNINPLVVREIKRIDHLVDRVQTATSPEELMGIEGEGARRYFSALRWHIRPPWTFHKRTRRPPKDPVNALLSLSYTLLHESCYSALEAAGLDPYWGLLHKPSYGRASLALDLMEEFRPVIADLVALRLLNLHMVSPKEFTTEPEKGGVHLNRDAWRDFAAEYSRRMATRVQIPETNRRTTYQRLLEYQARQIRKAIEHNTEYQPFLAK